MMRRREFITLLGGAAAWPLAARAQQPAGKIFRIGFVGLPTADSLPKRPEAFRAGLRDLGYQEGRNVNIEYRWANEQYERLPALFAEMVGLNVDVIVTHGTPGILAAKQVTTTIPIVFAAAGDAGCVGSRVQPSAAGRECNRIDVLQSGTCREATRAAQGGPTWPNRRGRPVESGKSV